MLVIKEDSEDLFVVVNLRVHIVYCMVRRNENSNIVLLQSNLIDLIKLIQCYVKVNCIYNNEIRKSSYKALLITEKSY